MFFDQKVEFTSRDSTELRGFITRPRDNTKKHPAVLLFEGSGKSPHQKEQENDPFRVIAQHLSKAGFVVMRYNKRGSGYNYDRGDFANAMISTHLEDARSALILLKRQSFVDQSNIFLFGQSMGGTRAAALALEDIEVKGITLFATPSFSPKGHSFVDFNNEQLSYIYKYAYQYDEDQVNEKLAENTKLFNSIKDNSLKCSDYTKSELVACTVKNEKIYLDGVTIDYFKEALSYDQLDILSKVKCPILIIQGESDWVVPKSNAFLAEQILKKERKEDYQLSIIKNLDHVFAENKTIKESVAYMMAVGQGKSTFKPLQEDFIRTFTDWLYTRVNE